MTCFEAYLGAFHEVALDSEEVQGVETFLGASLAYEAYEERHDMMATSCLNLGESYYTPFHFQTVVEEECRRCR